MLGKVLKYDLKFVYKVVVVFYILALIFSLLTRIFFSIENSLLFNIIGQIVNGAMISMLISSLINSLMRSWVRFVHNVYKDEAYLTHTLPVKKKTIYLAKVLTAVICSFTTVLVALLCLFISYYSKANIEVLRTFLRLTAESYDITVIGLLAVISIVVFLEILFIILIGYVGIIIGHKTNKNKMLKSIILGIGLYLVTSTFTLAIIYIYGLFDEKVMNVINTTDIINVDAIKHVMIAGIGIYVVYNAIYYIIGKRQLEKGVNVE